MLINITFNSQVYGRDYYSKTIILDLPASCEIFRKHYIPEFSIARLSAITTSTARNVSLSFCLFFPFFFYFNYFSLKDIILGI